LLAVLIAQDIVLATLLAVMPIAFGREQEAADAMENGSGGKPAQQDVGTRGGPDLPRELLSRGSMRLPLAGLGVLLLVILRFVTNVRQRRWALCLVCRCRGRVGTMLLGLEDEFFAILLLSCGFSLAFATDHFGLSTELGAFLAGLTLRNLWPDVGIRMEHHMEALKDTFVAWFFASIGLVVNPMFLWDNLLAVLTVVMIIFVLKLVTGFLPLWLVSGSCLSHASVLAALRTSWILAHVSEFGFVLASKCYGWGVFSRHVYLLLVGANAVSLCLAPWQFRARECLLPQDQGGSPVRGGGPRHPSPRTIGVRRASSGSER